MKDGKENVALTKSLPVGKVRVTGSGNYLVALIIKDEQEVQPEKKAGEDDSDNEEPDSADKKAHEVDVQFIDIADDNKVKFKDTFNISFGNMEYFCVFEKYLIIKSKTDKMVCYNTENRKLKSLNFPYSFFAEHVIDTETKELVMVRHWKNGIQYCAFPCMLNLGGNIFGCEALKLYNKLGPVVDPAELLNKNISELMGLYIPPQSLPKPASNEINTLLLMLASYNNGMSPVIVDSIRLSKPQTILNSTRNPFCININQACVSSLINLLQYYYEQCVSCKNQAVFDDIFTNFVCILEITRGHFAIMQAVHMQIFDCLDPVMADKAIKLIEKIVLPLTASYPFTLKPTSEKIGEALRQCGLKFLPQLLNLKYTDKAALLLEIMTILEKIVKGSELDPLALLILSGLGSKDIKEAIRDLSIKCDKKAQLFFEGFFTIEENYIKNRFDQFEGKSCSNDRFQTILKDLGKTIETTIMYMLSTAK